MEIPRIPTPRNDSAGEHDRLLGTGAPRRLAARIPGAAFEILADSGYDLTLEQPAVTAARVSRFLALAAPEAPPDENARGSPPASLPCGCDFGACRLHGVPSRPMNKPVKIRSPVHLRDATGHVEELSPVVATCVEFRGVPS